MYHLQRTRILLVIEKKADVKLHQGNFQHQSIHSVKFHKCEICMHDFNRHISYNSHISLSNPHKLLPQFHPLNDNNHLQRNNYLLEINIEASDLHHQSRKSELGELRPTYQLCSRR